MVVLEPTLFSVAIGILVLVGYLIQYYHFNIPTFKTPPALFSWLGKTWVKEQDKTQGGTLVPPLDDESNLFSSCSSDWWEDDGLFQLEKRAIFSQVGDSFRKKIKSDNLVIVMALCDACV